MYRIEPDVKKIAVLRANAIGDLIFSLPALDALRAAYPAAEIVLLGQQWHSVFFEGRPGPISRVVAVPPLHGIHEEDGRTISWDSAEAEGFFERMAAERFDLAIQLHGGGGHSNSLIRRLRARLSVGLRTPDAELLDRWLPFYYYQSEIMRALEVVSLVGAGPVGVEPRLAVLPGDVEESERVVPPTVTPLVLLHPGAGDGRRRWPVTRFIEVGDALAAAGAKVLVSGSGWEQELVDDIIGQMQQRAQDVCDRLSLRGLAGVLSRCALVVSNDSGPLHVAMAVGAATVGIFWCGNLITAGPMMRAFHRPVISWRLLCPVCGQDCTVRECEHHVSFVADIPTAPVIRHALELLGNARGQVP